MLISELIPKVRLFKCSSFIAATLFLFEGIPKNFSSNQNAPQGCTRCAKESSEAAVHRHKSGASHSRLRDLGS